MTRQLPAIAIALCLLAPAAPAAPKKIAHQSAKEAANAAIERNAAEMTRLSDEIWAYAERALVETKSSAALASWAETKGFKVTRGVAGMPTAFVAEYGSGSPVIGIMGEFDALPGVSQKALPAQEALVAGAPGHGCGHNLFGVGSLGAAIAIRDLIEAGKLKGTLKFFGTPAEEAFGGKIYMLRDGIFKDVDVMLAWHPSDETQSDTKSSQAIIDVGVEFIGKSAHAAYDPWNARSAADGAEIFTFAVNAMREHIRPSSRMHYVVLDAGDVPNVVPNHAKIWMWMRDAERKNAEEMLERVKRIAEGAALAAGVTSTLKIQGGSWEMVPLMSAQRVAYDNMAWLGAVPFTEAEQEFAKSIQRETKVAETGLKGELKPFDDKPGPPEGGSTDVGDVSWGMPTIHISVATSPYGAPWHAWPVVATGGMSIGHKGMLYASKALAATMIDLFSDAKLREEIREEFEKKTAGVSYKPYVPDGPPPVPEYQ